MRRALFGFIIAISMAAPAAAQEAAPVPHCSGLLCDLGVFGGAGSEKTSLPCNDFLCRSMGGSPRVEATSAVPAPEPLPAPKTTTRKGHSKVAKTARREAPPSTIVLDKK